MSLPGGISPDDFDNFPLADHGRTVSRTPSTKTEDAITGRENLASGSAGNITAIVSVRDITWTQDEIAKLEGANGYIQVSATTTLNEHDLVTFDNKTYECIKVITIRVAGTAMFKYGLLLLKS